MNERERERKWSSTKEFDVITSSLNEASLLKKVDNVSSPNFTFYVKK